MENMPTPPVKEIEVRLIYALLRRQFRTILITAATVFGLAGVFLSTVTETYTATALILVDPDNQNILNTGAAYPTSAGRDNARVDSEVEILRSDATSLMVVANEGLATDPEFGARLPVSEKLARAVGIANAAPASYQQITAKTLARFKAATSIRRKGLTYLITVSTTSRSPAKAAYLANQLSQAYIAQQVDAKISSSLAARDVLEDQIKASRLALASYEMAFEQFLDDNLARLSNEIGSDALKNLRSELDVAERALAQKQQDQTSARQFLQQQNWAALGATLGDRQLAFLGNQRVALLDTISGAASAKPEPDFQQSLTVLDQKLSAQSAAGLRTLSAQLQDISQNIAGLRGQMRQSVLSSDLSPGLLIEIYAIQQETSIARAQHDNLLSRMREFDTQANIQIADSRVVSPAIEPIVVSYPNRNLVLLAALGMSLGLGVSLAFLKEYYIGGITSASQLSELMLAPTAASIPLSNDQNSGQLSVAEKIIDAPLSIYSESVRKLRAAIDQNFRSETGAGKPGTLGGGKMILVTSTLSDEGKTTTALSLARTYAQAGRKTLLIDADLRKPSIHRQLGFEPQVGFLDYLQNASQTELTGSFYARDPASSLALIMGAARSEYPTDQLLSSATFEALLAQAKEVYDVVVVDSPPLLPVVDARYIAHYADAVVIVVKWAATGQTDLKLAVQPLRAAMKPSAALLPVLTQVRLRAGDVEYGGYDGGYSAAI